MLSELSTHAAPALTREPMGSLDRPRVLVAEDNDDVLAAIGLLLRSNGYDAEFVKSPDAIRAALHARHYDAVLLDLNYSRDTTSGAEGLELLSSVQAVDPTLAVVAMTAWGTIELAVDAMHRGACEFVQKPWDNAHLLQILNKQIKRTRELRHRRFNDQLEQQEATQIQRALLPSGILTPDGLTIAVSIQSARNVGGDYYDVIRLGERRLAICIADVMGKGVGAALLMSNLQASVRVLAPQLAEPYQICNRINRMISASNASGRFITFLYCVIDLDEMRISYTNAGHNWPILARRSGECEWLSTKDVVLGTVPQWSYHQQDTELHSGDRLVLFTDGITESTNRAGTEFGEEYLARLVARNVHLPANKLKDLILTSAISHAGGAFSDDATLIVAHVH